MTPPELSRGGPPSSSAKRSTGTPPAAGELDEVWVMAVELVAVILVWGGLGYLLDRVLHTAPWVALTGFTVGSVVGIYLVWLRGVGEVGHPPAERTGTPPNKTTEDPGSERSAHRERQ